MHTYEKQITVSPDDLDELNHVNNVCYVQWVNDIAKEHWYQCASPEMLRDYIWVVIKHCIQYKGAAFLNDVLKLKTYVSLSEGVTSLRIVEIYNATSKKLLVKSEINFCLLNKQNNRPTRIPENILNLFVKS